VAKQCELLVSHAFHVISEEAVNSLGRGQVLLLFHKVSCVLSRVMGVHTYYKT
jgi:hypothetical protein